MSESTDNLGRKEAMLMLYLANELPESERGQVDRMLEADEALRRMLDELRRSQAMITVGLARLDAGNPLPAAPVLARGIGRSMRQWQVERLTRPTPAAGRPVSHFAWRSYGLAAAAAAAIVVCVVWWSRVADRSPAVVTAGGATAAEAHIAEELEPALAMRQLLTAGVNPGPNIGSFSDPLSLVEEELDGVRLLREDIQ
jgi:anti-sigma-K factor RskA